MAVPVCVFPGGPVPNSPGECPLPFCAETFVDLVPGLSERGDGMPCLPPVELRILRKRRDATQRGNVCQNINFDLLVQSRLPKVDKC